MCVFRHNTLAYYLYLCTLCSLKDTKQNVVKNELYYYHTSDFFCCCNLFVTLRGLIIKLYSTKLRLGMQTSDFWQLLRKNKSIELEWNKTLPIMHQWECMPYSLIFPPQALIKDSSPLDLSYHRWRIPEGVVTHLFKTNICFTLFWRKKSLFYSFWLRWVKSTFYFEVMLVDWRTLLATISLTGVYFC